ncbi:phosphoribosylanthranilate isomerase [Terribacillus saccharophilus]|uniref:N-(5'-phosphoribosyl)anthranilate isomerase n=1 Tax=Terribacillus saccharophilus TaxID=361277 RepID=A0ABX4GX55_9BACI|nr:phosphoribosylanthranilate isomerase [Terribacillus saccharophilus]PAD35444.1 phosphoribosylanthranilate isomerase [Terribacillus saccharophilus]PAD96199.1 phosphoribosylanthranilate isomerase [Terribacillus saccharophilus]PAD99466.1 phosphoribosylanthranilate isomerase [Terribacillus saccharophilus]
MIVKICGIQSVETGRMAVEAGADMIGFVFADSRRKVSPEQAARIGKELPAQVKKVGVFVNEPIESLLDIVETAGLDYIQLHGDETPDYVKAINKPVIKAFSVASEDDLKQLADYQCEYYLLDSPAEAYRGGNGTAFDWSLASSEAISREKLFLAGGLHSENVQQAIGEVSPVGVDVSSGVETEGQKDPIKIKQFITAAKRGQ